MEKKQINFTKDYYNSIDYKRTINTNFTQLVPQVLPTQSLEVNISDFFTQYNKLFYTIPLSGSTQTHEYLVKQSSAYLGLDISPENVQALIDEITELREENLELTQEILDTQNLLANITSSNGEV